MLKRALQKQEKDSNDDIESPKIHTVLYTKPLGESNSQNQSESIKTDAFTIQGNNVTIHANSYKQFLGLKNSLKSAGGKYNSNSKSWYLTDDQLQAWKKSQSKYGWFKKVKQ